MNIPEGLIIKHEAFKDSWIESVDGVFYICEKGSGKAYDKDGNLYSKETRRTFECRSLSEAILRIMNSNLLNTGKILLNLTDVILHYKTFSNVCQEMK